MNIKSICSYNIPHLFTYSDGSDTGLASICKDHVKLNIWTKTFWFYRKNRKFYFETAGIKNVFFGVNEKVVVKQTPKMAYRRTTQNQDLWQNQVVIK